VNVKLNNKQQVISGKWVCPYSHKYITLNDKKQISKQVQIDHVLPWAFYKKNAQNCNRAIEFYNDIDNLVASDSDANRRKSDSIDYSQYDQAIKIKACYICKKYNLDNCEKVCF
jgi:hypothetical protein